MKQNKETIKSYFQTGDKPTQSQYYDTWDSFWHKDDVLPSTGAISNAQSSDTHIISIEDHGGIADNGTTDSSQAFLDAVDELIALGGGTLLIPNRGSNRFYITNNQTLLIKDMSNITITGGGKIYIDGSNTGSGAQSVTQGRGVLLKIANGTDNFTVRDIDILTAENCLANNFINAVFCQEELGSWSNITFEKVKIHSEARPDTQIGNHAISFHRDTTNASDIAKCFNLTIRDCDIYLTGQSVYGIHTLRDIENILIDNNVIELTAYDNNSTDAYNAIALYGDCKNFSVTNNTINSSGHSAIAASMAENGVIAFNRVYNVSIGSEAGIEVEYKEGHGTNLTDPDFQTKSVKVHNNYVEACYWGIAVLAREPFATSSTKVPPYDVIISNNTVINSENIDIVVASNVSGTPDYTGGRIKYVSVLYNYIESMASNSNIHFYDSDGGKIIGNTMIGGSRNLYFGRNTTIIPIGNFMVKDNTMLDAQVTCFHVESMGANAYIEISGNDMDGFGNGIRGIQALSLHESGVIYNVHHNTLKNFTDGIRMDGESADIANSMWSNNIVRDCTVRGIDVAAVDGIATDNITINCITADTYTGTGMTANGNKDL